MNIVSLSNQEHTNRSKSAMGSVVELTCENLDGDISLRLSAMSAIFDMYAHFVCVTVSQLARLID